ncbi:TPA: multiple antibiotic resistance protein MarB [Citrobacter freundii]
MKSLSPALLALTLTLSGASLADDNVQPSVSDDRDEMIMPSANDRSPYDFNHMSTESDKSDKLGVPYYH